MKKLIITTSAICIFINNAAFAAATVSTETNSSGYICQEQQSIVLTPEDSSISVDTSSCSNTAQIIYNTRTQNGASVSTSYHTTYCTACKSGYTLTERSAVSTNAPNCRVNFTACLKQLTIPCQGQSCAGHTTWETDTTKTGNQSLCNTSTQKCQYRCAPGYYRSGLSLPNSPLTCKPCPTNGTCAAGVSKPTCNKGYYMYDASQSSSGGVTIGKTYECRRCPSSGGVYGTTSAAGAESITECYLPSGTTGSDATGSFTYTSNCYYSE